LTPEELFKIWGNGLTIVKRTLEATTQLAFRTVVPPSIERCLPTGDRPLRHKRLHHQVYHDNKKAEVKSLGSNKCCEIYTTDFGWPKAFPLKKESDVHETLDLLLLLYGIPEALV
jgi:hypothetical protein